MPAPSALDWLTGERCTGIREHAEGCFAFEIGGGGLNTACAWRLLVDGRLTVAHRDNKLSFGLTVPHDVCVRAMNSLAGRSIVGAGLDAGVGDLTIDFEGSRRLQVINDSAVHEGWSLIGPDRFVLVAASGGSVSGYAGRLTSDHP